jgi:hypothetical protein
MASFCFGSVTGTARGSSGGATTTAVCCAGAGVGRQGCHALSRVKASTVGFVMASAVGIDGMHPDKATPARHAAARFEIDSIFAAPAVDSSRAAHRADFWRGVSIV